MITFLSRQNLKTFSQSLEASTGPLPPSEVDVSCT